MMEFIAGLLIGVALTLAVVWLFCLYIAAFGG